MAVQNTYQIKCDPQVAFDCAIKTLQTFKIDGQTRINHRFMTVSTTFFYSLPSDAIAARKILMVSILPLENGYCQLQITGDHRPMSAYNKGNVILTIAEFLDRYDQMLNQANA